MAGKQLKDFDAAGALSDADILYGAQAGAEKKVSLTQVAAYLLASGLGGASGGAATPALSNWFAGGIQGKKAVWAGDSTTAQLQLNMGGVLDAYNQRYVTEQGSPLYGVTNTFIGNNGATAAVFLADGVPGSSISAVIAAAPDLIIYSYGINDVRLGNTTLAQLIAIITQTVNALRAALPNVAIVLRMPNSFLTTDVGGNGYVSPNGSAQAYSAILSNAYLALTGKWSNVVVYDAQATAFSRTSLAASLYMGDQIHPNVDGYLRMLDGIVGLIGQPPAFNQAQANDAQNANYGDAHTLYALVVEGGDYDLITDGWFVGNGSGYIDFSGDVGKVAAISQGDIVVQNSAVAFDLVSGDGAINQAGNIRLLLSGGRPSHLQAGGRVGIYRHKYGRIPGAKAVLSDSRYTVIRKCIIYGAGSNYMVLGPVAGEAPLTAWNLKSTDSLLHPDLGLISLSGAGASLSGNNMNLQATGNFTTSKRYAYLLATDALRPGTQVPEAIALNMSGALTAGPLVKPLARGGEFRNLFAKLGTAGSTQTVATVSIGGSVAVTLTFAPGSQFSGVSWPGGVIYAMSYTDIALNVTSIGTGAKDLSILIDV